MNKLMNDSSGEKPLEEWSILYCGGSKSIVKDLKDISKRYGIVLAVEKFDCGEQKCVIRKIKIYMHMHTHTCSRDIGVNIWNACHL